MLLVAFLFLQVIDASAKGNLGRFVNHSCDPNCRTEKVSTLVAEKVVFSLEAAYKKNFALFFLYVLLSNV